MGTVTRMELRKIDELHPYERNAKLHPPEQIEKLRKSFREFGMIVPVGIDDQDRVVYGHGRILAAQAEGWTEVPTGKSQTSARNSARHSCTRTTS